jgi:hypothetical protein
MGSKDKTVSFRVRSDKFTQLKEISEGRDLSLSSLFREYVDMLLAHDGRVEIVPEHVIETNTVGDDFPVKIEVPKSFVREHERLELEADHLHEQLEEHKRYVAYLEAQLEDRSEDVLLLDDLDGADAEEAVGRSFDPDDSERSFDPDEPSFRLG